VDRIVRVKTKYFGFVNSAKKIKAQIFNVAAYKLIGNNPKYGIEDIDYQIF